MKTPSKVVRSAASGELATRHAGQIAKQGARQGGLCSARRQPRDCGSQRVTILYSYTMATRKPSPRKTKMNKTRTGEAHKISRKASAPGKTVLYLYGITPNTKAFAARKLALPSVDGSSQAIALPCGELLAWASSV